MKVILKADVKGQGKKGDMIEVSEGYGRNFLLPRGLAVAATADNLNLKRQADEAAAHRAALRRRPPRSMPKSSRACASRSRPRAAQAAACSAP